MSETTDSLKDAEPDLPEQCKPSEANWIVVIEKPHYPKVMFFREEREAKLWYDDAIKDVNPADNYDSTRAVAMAPINQKHVFIDVASNY